MKTKTKKQELHGLYSCYEANFKCAAAKLFNIFLTFLKFLNNIITLQTYNTIIHFNITIMFK